jgi:hypothetical protein
VLGDPVQADPEGEMIHNWVEAVEGMAWVARRRGDHPRAARLLGAAASVRSARRLPFPSGADHDAHEQDVTELAADLGPSWLEHWEAGRALTPHQTIAEALAEVNRAPAG